MSDIRIALPRLDEPAQSIGIALIAFYEEMKALENDPHRGGKQATKIVMTINDIEEIFNNKELTSHS
jgi:hypothetical protein